MASGSCFLSIIIVVAKNPKPRPIAKSVITPGPTTAAGRLWAARSSEPGACRFIDDCSAKLTIEKRTIVEILTTTYVFDKEKVNNVSGKKKASKKPKSLNPLVSKEINMLTLL